MEDDGMTATLEHDPARAVEDRTGFDRVVSLLKHFAAWMRSRQNQVQVSYLIPERSGFGWYVVAKEPAFDFELNRQLAEFGTQLIRKGFPIHVALLPGSISPTIPTDGISITPSGQVETYAG
jgi:hypothetical protein